MPSPRVLVFVLATLTPAVAYRLGGTSLWIGYAVGLAAAAAIAAYVLWNDDLLESVLRPKGLDLSSGFAGAAALYALCWFAYNRWIAPADELGGLLRRCGLDGVLVPRREVYGVRAALEWARGEVCRAYGHSLALQGGARGLAVVVLAVLEEMAWRGGVQQGLSEKLGSTRGYLAATGLYAAAQLVTGNAVLALLALGGGLVWGGLYRYRGRLAPAMFSHAVFNYFAFYQRALVDFT